MSQEIAIGTIAGIARRKRSVEREVSGLDFSTNDYLGLRNDPRVRAAAIAGIEEFGVGSGGAREVAAGTALIRELERRIVLFKGTRGAWMVQSGYVANMGVVPVLVGPGDLVFLDRQNHQSTKDGALLSGASVVIYPHADVDALERELKKSASSAPGKTLIVTDGVFGLTGDIAPLPEIIEAAERHGAMVMVDDAHGSGVLGRGRGTVAHFGLTERVAVQVGTASKAMGVLGGYVTVMSEEILERFADARPMTHSTALPAHLAAACLTALDVIEAEPQRIDRLWANRERFAAGLVAAGLDIGCSQTPILPIPAGTPETTIELGRRLRSRGVLASVHVPPKVQPEQSRLRFTVTTDHTAANIDLAVSLIAEAARDLGIRLHRTGD
jgi:8-amino-7-oxononanoate synthase